MIKLYYNKYPYKNIVNREQDGVDVWNDLPNNPQDSSFYKVLNSLGIEYQWSDNPDDSIVIADVGSLHHRTPEFDKVIEHVANSYKKAIILSTQEPWQKDTIDKILGLYPNIMLSDCHYPLANANIYHDRYIPFQYYFTSISNIEQNIVIKYPDIDYKEHVYLFNCLMFNWRPDKHILRTALRYSNIEDNLITFRHENCKDKIDQIKRFVEHSDNERFKSEALTRFDDSNLPFDDIVLQPNKRQFDQTFRAWPKRIFDQSVFSLVCESFSGTETQAGPYVTEKSLYPLLNGHPLIVFGEKDYYKYLTSYGFVIHDELFNYNFDSEPDPIARSIFITEQIKGMNIDIQHKINPYNAVTRQKARHNQYLLNNRASTLWRKLKQEMTTNIQRYLDL